ncbi:cell division protein SepF [Helcobacillus massiliensis]|uniref:Cell division protein SepF n=1 Tax=Helcobacillus massiliensis TaxID=521392 RepID=A0A839QMZ1_9MICO|nr:MULTISPECIES: cell division protein SepF [Helcobacillus]MBB3021843.1 cell division inhibitor SepF [Helcobacillus massiliensis]MCG7427123.1 cell division protein SepF [Helcobacillus sp. ACRRO]MCT1557828.1 cell division protein SepF [Helcobacillus massiliensis]MCT2036676.1 cell division protein SepF [Helcobacillus massiliensis]MCT2332147.1 cell division protein SepF [Helcobacillus massiliensis]
MSAMRKAMVYLGLADQTDDDQYYYDDLDSADQQRPAPVAARAVENDKEPLEREAHVTPIRQRQQNIVSVAPSAAPDAMQRITTIHPRSYNDAKSIGESFRDGVPVILNLSDMDEADAKRMVDFSAGLVFGLRGSIERVTNKVFLLSPEFIQVDGDAKGEENTFYNQS